MALPVGGVPISFFTTLTTLGVAPFISSLIFLAGGPAFFSLPSLVADALTFLGLKTLVIGEVVLVLPEAVEPEGAALLNTGVARRADQVLGRRHLGRGVDGLAGGVCGVEGVHSVEAWPKVKLSINFVTLSTVFFFLKTKSSADK